MASKAAGAEVLEPIAGTPNRGSAAGKENSHERDICRRNDLESRESQARRGPEAACPMASMCAGIFEKGTSRFLLMLPAMRRTSTLAGWTPVLAVLLAAMSPVVSRTDEGSESPSEVAFPEGYRDWTLVKSMVILPGHVHYEAFGGFHHVYANDKALAALKQGGSFPKGAVLVFDLLKESVEDNAIVEGARQVVGVMEKDWERFATTEGWGFEDFREGDPLQPSVTDMREQCLSCHETRSATDYVYSTYHE